MRLAVITMILVALAAMPLMAQTPNVQVFFDNGYSQAEKPCPPGTPGTVMDTLYVVAQNFNMFINAMEFQVSLPPQLSWVADIPTTSIAIGNTQTGVAYTWSLPQDGFVPFEVLTMLVFWQCNSCLNNQNAPIVVQGHPVSGLVRASRWPDNVLVNGVGQTSLICSTVPVEETTWGQVKSLYGN